MMVIEAMKMEHTIAAPRDGIVAAVHYAAGDPVEEGAELIALAEEQAGLMRDEEFSPGLLHLLKMAVGVGDIDELRRFRAARLKERGAACSIPATTRAAPRRCWPAARSTG